jgi:hypothetical protein
MPGVPVAAERHALRDSAAAFALQWFPGQGAATSGFDLFFMRAECIED